MSLLSTDSGYASMTPEVETPIVSTAAKRRSLFVLPSLGFLKRKDKAAVTLEVPQESNHASDWPLRPQVPTREHPTTPTPATESLTV
jgi:hypothetical protein